MFFFFFNCFFSFKILSLSLAPMLTLLPCPCLLPAITQTPTGLLCLPCPISCLPASTQMPLPSPCPPCPALHLPCLPCSSLCSLCPPCPAGACTITCSQ